MWIDLYIDGKPVNSWPVGQFPAEGFSEAAYNERKSFLNEKIAQCTMNASDLLCECRHYQFAVRIKSALTCKLLPGEETVKVPHHEEWQELFVEENAWKMTARQLADGVGLTLNWVYKYCKRNRIKFLKASKLKLIPCQNT